MVVRHSRPSVDPALDAEGYLLGVATGLEISGAGPDVLRRDLVHEVLATWSDDQPAGGTSSG